MKKTNSIIIYFLAAITLFSCTKNDTGISIPKALKISINKTTVVANGIDEITVTVKDQDSTDITSSSVIMVDGQPILGNAVFFDINKQGNHKIFANKYSVLSDTLTVATSTPPTAKYTSKVLAEDFTAAWCGWCPRVDYKLNNFMLANNKLYTIRYHSNDALADRTVDSFMRATYGFSSVPKILVNRTGFMNENGDISNLADSTEFRNFYQRYAVTGLALNTSVAGNTLNVTTKIGFDVTIKDSLRLTVILVENNKTFAQNNFYNHNDSYPGNPFYNSGDTITNYTQNAIYKFSPTTVKGIIIPVANQVKDGEYTANFSLDITGLNTANLQVIAFLSFAEGQTRKGMLNVQWVNAGQNKNYD